MASNTYSLLAFDFLFRFSRKPFVFGRVKVFGRDPCMEGGTLSFFSAKDGVASVVYSTQREFMETLWFLLQD
jgi:hypothetical protein